MPRRPAQPKPSAPSSPDAAAPPAAAKPVRQVTPRADADAQAAPPAAPKRRSLAKLASTDAAPLASAARPKRSIAAGDTAAHASPRPEPTAPPAPKPRGTARLSPAGALPPARIPPESLQAPRSDRLLLIAASVSIAIHLAVLAIHFTPIVLKDWDKGPPLEVALVNAKSKTKPAKADVLAQANLDGGGNTDQNRRAKSPLPVMPKASAANDLAQTAQQVAQLERQAREVMTQLKAVAPTPAAAPPAPEVGPTPELPDARELMQRTLEAMQLEAQIAKDLDMYQKRPKRRFVGARAEEYRFARYVEDWRLKIERVGNMNYPEAARREKLYGSLLITVSIKADGRVEAIEINRSSGHRLLDAAAVKIVEMSAPFAPFPPDIKRDTDILHITRTWSFTKGDELVSQ
jgi:protein TonB